MTLLELSREAATVEPSELAGASATVRRAVSDLADLFASTPAAERKRKLADAAIARAPAWIADKIRRAAERSEI